MTDSLPKAYLTRTMVPRVLERLRSLCDVTINPADRTATREELIESLGDTVILVPSGPDDINAEVLESAPKLKLIANFGVGYNNIAVETATRLGIALTNTPGVLSDATADIAWALLLNATRRIGEGDRMIRAGAWKGWGPLQLLGGDLAGSTLGIIGMGNIGKAMVPRAKGFSMRVIYWNRTRLSPQQEKDLGIEYYERDDLIREADYLSLHVALTADTTHLISYRELDLMKPSAYLVNTTRGPVVDEKALVDALREGKIAGAGLDVFENEPEVEAELMGLENVVLTPHLGSGTIGTRTRMGMMVADSIEAFIKGLPYPNLVNEDVLIERKEKGSNAKC